MGSGNGLTAGSADAAGSNNNGSSNKSGSDTEDFDDDGLNDAVNKCLKYIINDLMTIFFYNIGWRWFQK